MHWCLSVVWSVYILNDTKSDIGSTVDLVDTIVLWHGGLYGKKILIILSRRRVVFSGLCLCPYAVWLLVSVDWGSSLVTNALWRGELNIKSLCFHPSYPVSLYGSKG